MDKIINKNKKGISIIEILVAITIIIVGLAGLLGLVIFSLKVSNLIKETNQANTIAQETIEAVRNFRDGTEWDVDGLGTLPDVFYYPQQFDSPPKWRLIQGTETVGVFTRKVLFENVMRDTNGNIVVAGGTNDPNTKKATITVSWDGKEIKIVTYFTNWK